MTFDYPIMTYQMPKLLTPTVIYTLTALMLMGFVITSCGGKGSAVNPTSSTTKLLVVNTSPDAGPVTMFINNVQLGNTTSALTGRLYFRYITTPVYYSIGTGSLAFQLKQLQAGQYVSLLSGDTINVATKVLYSIFLVGLAGKDSLSIVNTVDTSSLPSLGKGKIRFLNVSPRTPPLDMVVNGTPAFTKIAYKGISKYIEIPAGIYDFKINATGASTSVLTDLSRITIQDGKIYTLYTKGLVGRTDTAALSLNVITNQ